MYLFALIDRAWDCCASGSGLVLFFPDLTMTIEIKFRNFCSQKYFQASFLRLPKRLNFFYFTGSWCSFSLIKFFSNLIFLGYSADGSYELKLLTKAVVYYTGDIYWQPPAIYKGRINLTFAASDDIWPQQVTFCQISNFWDKVSSVTMGGNVLF